MYFNFLGLGAGSAILLLVAFAGLQWLHIPAGNFLDWMVGLVTFWWLLVITTVPWNIHFDAKQVIAEAALSKDKEIKVEQAAIDYAKVVARRALWVAIGLHLCSGIGLYVLSAIGVTKIGYVSAGAALLLTILRPSVEAYRYLAIRLAMIRQDFKYPREDIQTVLERLSNLESDLKTLQQTLDVEDPSSWATQVQRQAEGLRGDLTRLAASQEDLKATNQAEHQRLSREAEQAIARLSTDSQFLDHVREIIRFFKAA